MLNLTICALSLTSASSSPLFSLRDSSTFSKNRFSRHLSPVLFSTRYSTLDVTFCNFERIIGGAVRLNSASEYESQTFTKQQKVSESSGTTTFTSCLFKECEAGDDTGGGLKFGSWSSRASLRVNKCGFFRCQADTNGGGIYCECADVEIKRTCFDKCGAKSYAAAFFEVSSSSDISDSYVSNIERQTSRSVFHVECDKSRVTSMNITDIDVRDATGALEVKGSSVTCSMIYFGKCDMANVLAIEESQETVKYVNFVETRGREVLIRVSESAKTFEDCAFVKDRSSRIIEKYATFRNCVFSEAYDPGQFPMGLYTPDCKFNVGWTTKAIDLRASDVCWERMPTPEPTKSEPTEEPAPPVQPTEAPASNKGITIGIVVAVICCLLAGGFIAFFLYRWCRGPSSDQKLLLMYAQV